jgi:hypothetical protein
MIAAPALLLCRAGSRADDRHRESGAAGMRRCRASDEIAVSGDGGDA